MTNHNDHLFDEVWHGGAPVEGLTKAIIDDSPPGLDWNRDEKLKESVENGGFLAGFTPDPFILALERLRNDKESPKDSVSFPEPPISRSKAAENAIKLALERVEGRSTGYGHENSFPAIRRLWNAFLRNRPQSEAGFIDLTDAEVADILLLFKVGRKQTRRASGQYKQDDNVDAIGYLHWAAILEEGTKGGIEDGND